MFIRYSHEILELSYTERDVLAAIASRFNFKNDSIYPKRDDLAKLAGVDISIVSKATTKLKKQGLINIQKVGKKNHYYLTEKFFNLLDLSLQYQVWQESLGNPKQSIIHEETLTEKQNTKKVSVKLSNYTLVNNILDKKINNNKDFKLTPAESLILLAVANKFYYENPTIFCGLGYLEEVTGIKTPDKALKKLEEKGLIESYKSNKYKSKEYQLTETLFNKLGLHTLYQEWKEYIKTLPKSD